MTATPDRHDGESLRVSQHGFHVGYARSVPELERWVELAELEQALWPARHPRAKPCGRAAAPQLPVSGSWRGLYQADPHPSALHATFRCPGPLVRSARAGAQSHGENDTSTRPGPHGCPCWQ
jgi:hypothetical protein